MSVIRDLQKVKLEDVGLRGSNPIFINAIGCSGPKVKDYAIYKKINYFIPNGKIKIKLQEKSKPLAITHAEILKNTFPVDLTPSLRWELLSASVLFYVTYVVVLSCIISMHLCYGLLKNFRHAEVFHVETNQLKSV